MAVSQMDKVTQSSASSAEENASAAGELNGQVDALQTFVAEMQMIVSGQTPELGRRPLAASPDSAPRPRKFAGAKQSPGTARTNPSKSTGLSLDRDIPMPEPISRRRPGDIQRFFDQHLCHPLLTTKPFRPRRIISSPIWYMSTAASRLGRDKQALVSGRLANGCAS